MPADYLQSADTSKIHEITNQCLRPVRGGHTLKRLNFEIQIIMLLRFFFFDTRKANFIADTYCCFISFCLV